MHFRVLLTAAFCVALPLFVNAEEFNQPQLQTVFDDMMAELKKNGAKDVRGSLSYDNTSHTLSISKFHAAFSAKLQDPAQAAIETNSNEKSIEKKQADGNDIDLDISKITVAGLNGDAALWHAATVHVEDMTVKQSLQKSAFEIPAFDFAKIDAPKIAPAEIGKSLLESVSSLIQDSSFESALVHSAQLNMVPKNEDEDSTSKFVIKFGDVNFVSVTKGLAKSVTMAPSKINAVEQSDAAAPPAPAGKSLSKKSDDADDADAKKPTALTAEIGQSVVTNLDLGLYADLFRETPRKAGQKNLSFYKTATLDGATAKFGDEMSFKLGAIKASDARMTIPQHGFKSLASAIASDTVEGPDAAKLSGLSKEWIEAVTIGHFEAAGASFKSPETQVSFGPMAGSELGATVGEMTLGSFKFKSKDNTAGFDKLTLRKIDTATFTNALIEAAAENKEQPDLSKLEGKLPTFGLIRIDKLMVQSKDEEALHVESIALQLDEWVRLFPKHFSAIIEDAILPAAALKDIGHPDLKDLGYAQLTTGSNLQFGFDQKTKLLSVAPAKVDFGEAGSLDSSLEISNVDESMLGASIIGSDMAKLSETNFSRFTFSLSNGNFLERYIAWRVKQSGSSQQNIVDEIGQIFDSFAMFIPDEKQRDAAKSAIAQFLNGKGKTLALTVTPKEKLSLLDVQLGFMVNQESLAKKLNFAVMVK